MNKAVALIVALAFIPASASAFCYDLDEEQAGWVAGTCEDPWGEYPDYCAFDSYGTPVVREYHCPGGVTSNCFIASIVCQNGCRDGACIRFAEPTIQQQPTVYASPSPSPTPSPKPSPTPTPAVVQTPSAPVQGTQETPQFEWNWTWLLVVAVIVLAAFTWFQFQQAKQSKKKRVKKRSRKI